MKLTDLTCDQLLIAHGELTIARSHLISRAFGDLEQWYLDRADSLDPVIKVFQDAINNYGGASDGI